MKPSIFTYNQNIAVFGLLSFFALSLSLIQWQFSQLTGSTLVFGQGLLQLSLFIFLLFTALKPKRKPMVLAQFFSSFFILILCGLLLNQGYIQWQEEASIATMDALPIIVLSLVGALFLSKMIYLFVQQDFSAQAAPKTSKWIWLTSILVLCTLLLIYFTGWMWLDTLFAALIGVVLALTSVFFLIDSYWLMLEVED